MPLATPYVTHAPYEADEHDGLYGPRDQNRDTDLGLCDFLPPDPAPPDRSTPPESA